MDINTKKAITEHYTKLYEKYGYSASALGWPRGKQDIRFQAISQIGELKNKKILDVGCGFGHLFSYLKAQKIHMKYTGVDINEEFIKIAKKMNPKSRFEVRDIEKNPFTNNFDWVFAIGTTNESGSYQYIRNLLSEMFKISREGVAMDFLSSYVDFKKRGNFHVSPEKVFKIAKKLSKRVVIRHDYLPFEFCIYIYKNDKITKNLAFKKFK